MTAVSVIAIVLNWNLKQETVRCLSALSKSDTRCDVIIVDNGSEDDSAAYLAQQFPQAIMIALPTNAGFAAACNMAIRHALEMGDYDYIFLLNNDAVIKPDMLGRLLDVARNYPNGGIFGPKIFYTHSPATLWYAGAFKRPYVLAAVVAGRNQLDNGQFDHLHEVDFVFGTAMLIHRNVLQTIGVFDERFFVYLEDMDYCLRAKGQGYPVIFVPDAHIWHCVSASTRNDHALRRYHLVRSSLRFLIKHATPKYLVLLVVFWSLVFVRALIGDLSAAGLKSIRPYITGFRDAFAREPHSM